MDHTFFLMDISTNKCRKIMKIGVADGENARIMVRVAIQNFSLEEVEYHGSTFWKATEWRK
jgi:hypothetical protein